METGLAAEGVAAWGAAGAAEVLAGLGCWAVLPWGMLIWKLPDEGSLQSPILTLEGSSESGGPGAAGAG